MNDNIIKMFIGGEEVVSNKEFTINEEMLSASSTILNNCYPASWEESKDYVSNFYYPKDYSKFILGKGNFAYGTDQYSILTVSGEAFMQFTTNVEKELAGFSIYGNSYQATRSGKNKFTMKNLTGGTSTNAITYTFDNSIITLNGTTSYAGPIISTISTQITLPAGTYTYFCYLLGGSYNIPDGAGRDTAFYLRDTNDNQIIGATLKNAVFPLKRTFTLTESTELKIQIFSNSANQVFNNLMLGMQIVSGTVESSTFEQYGVMPSPNFPSDIVNVGYQNLIKNTNVNSGDYNYWLQYSTFDEATRTLTRSTTSTSESFILYRLSGLKSNTTYTLILYAKSNGYVRSMDLYCFNQNTQGIKAITVLPLTTEYQKYIFTFTTAGDITYDRNSAIRIDNNGSSVSGTEATLTIKDVCLVEGERPYDYIDYGKYGIEVKTVNANGNLFDKNNVYYGYLTNNGTINFNTSYRVSDYIGIESNYITISGNYGGSELNCFYDENYNFISSFGMGTLTSQTVQVPNNAKYIRVTVNSAKLSEYMLVLGQNISPYKQYESNKLLYVLDEPIRSANGVKDKFYFENNMLYIERNIGSLILDGVNNKFLIKHNTITSDTKGFYQFRLNNKTTSYGSGAIIGLSNYFKFVGPNSAFTAFNNNDSGIWSEGYTEFCYAILEETTLNNANNWLVANKPEIQYILANSYIQEIGASNIPTAYKNTNNIKISSGLETTTDINYYWKNFDVLFAGIVKNSGDISLRPTNPKYCSLQILDYKTFLSESDTLDFVISDKTIAEAITMVVDAISGYGFILGTINISQADDIIGAYSTLNKTAYDVFQYLANISGSRWRARFVDSDTMAIDFYDPELLPRANDIDYTQQYWEDNKIVDLTFNYGTRDYRNKQIILSDEVYGGIDYTEVLLSNGYSTSYITQNNIANITSITVNGVEAEVITQSEKDLGVDADFYYTPGKNVVESTISYTAGTQIIITYTPLVKGRQIVYNDEEVTRIATQTNTTGVISRYENRNDILSSDELENIAETYIKYKGKPEIILKLTTLNNDLFNIGEICYFNSPIADLAQDYMVKSKATNYTTVAGETNIFYTYELTSSFNSEKAINYFDNQRNKATGNIAEGESITRNIDINNSAMIIWENATITEISVSVDGDNALNSVLNSPFIQ